MAIWRRIVSGLRGVFRSGAVEREPDDEIRDFVERATEEGKRRGLAEPVARRAAQVALGSAAAVKDEVRTGLWESNVQTLSRDVRHGARMLRRTPGFAAVAILTLALGLG